jgi:N-methylhydantoinase A/acetophenone carboxylase
MVELDMKFGGQLNVKRTISPVMKVKSPDDVQAIYKAFEKEYSEAYSAMGLTPEAGVEIENFVLRATVPGSKPEVRKLQAQGGDLSTAQVGTRSAYWRDIGWQETPVYQQQRLQVGHGFKGPAIIEAEDTTVVVEPGWNFVVDEYGNGLLKNESPA